MVRPHKDLNIYKVQVDNSYIQESVSVRALGVIITNNLSWNDQIENVCQKVGQRTGLISRLKFKLNKDQLTCIIHGAILSHVKYCLSVYANVRIEDGDPRPKGFEKLQILLNNLARITNQVKLTDHVSREDLYKLSPWLSVNHMSAQSILVDTWKAMQNPTLNSYYKDQYLKMTRAASKGLIKPKFCSSFVNNGITLLNDQRFEELKHLTNKNEVKKHIKKYVRYLPL